MTQKRKVYAQRGQYYEEDQYQVAIEAGVDVPRLSLADDEVLTEAERIALATSDFQTHAFKKILEGEVVMMLDDHTNAVFIIQIAIMELGYGHKLEGEYADAYGEGTAHAVSAIQTDHGLTVTGAVNSETLKLIDGKLEALQQENSETGEAAEEKLHELIDPAWELKKAKWNTMGPAEIAADRELDWSVIKALFKTNDSQLANDYLKELLMEGWTPSDGLPEVSTWYENDILVVQAWTFSQAVQTAMVKGLDWDNGDIFHWKAHPKASANQFIALQTEAKRIAEDYAYAQESELPYKGTLEEFIARYQGSFDVYTAAHSIMLDPVVVTAKKTENIEGKRFVTVSPPITAIVAQPQKDEEDKGVRLRPKPIAAHEVGSDEKAQEALEQEVLDYLPLNTRVTILRDCEEHGWYYVVTDKNKKGYVNRAFINAKMPNVNYRYHVLEEGEKLMQVVRKYYNSDDEKALGQVELMGDYRNYILEIVRINEETNGKGGGVYFKEGVDGASKDAWDQIEYKHGYRIWIPDTGVLMQRLKARTDKEIFAQDWKVEEALDLGQTVLNGTAQTAVINTFLVAWESVPEAQRMANIKYYGGLAREEMEKMRSDDSMINLVLSKAGYLIPGGSMMNVARKVLTSMTIGFIDGMLNMNPKQLVAMAGRAIRKLTDIQFYMGALSGIVAGIKQWGTDIIDMFTGAWDMMKMIMSPEFREQISKSMSNAAEFIYKKKDEIMKSFEGMNLFQMLEAMMDGANAAVLRISESLGGKLAQGVVNLGGKSPYGFGHGVGKIGGMLLPDIVIGAVSSGAWAAAKGAITASKPIMKMLKPILKGVKATQKQLKAGKDAIVTVYEKLLKHKDAVFKFMGKSAQKFWKKLIEIFEKFKAFVRKKIADTPGGKKFLEVDGKVRDYAKKNYEKFKNWFKGDNKLDGENNTTENLKKVIWAKAYVELQDNLPISPDVKTVVAFLNTNYALHETKKSYKSTRFGTEKGWYTISVNPEIGDYSEGASEEDKNKNANKTPSGGYEIQKGKHYSKTDGFNPRNVGRLKNKIDSQEEFLEFIKDFKGDRDLINELSSNTDLLESWKRLKKIDGFNFDQYPGLDKKKVLEMAKDLQKQEDLAAWMKHLDADTIKKLDQDKAYFKKWQQKKWGERIEGDGILKKSGLDKEQFNKMLKRFDNEQQLHDYFKNLEANPDLLKRMGDKPELVDAWKKIEGSDYANNSEFYDILERYADGENLEDIINNRMPNVTYDKVEKKYKTKEIDRWVELQDKPRLGDDAAKKLDELRDMKFEDKPSVASVIEFDGDVVGGVSRRKGDGKYFDGINQGLEDLLDGVPKSKKSFWHGMCAEMGILSDILNKSFDGKRVSEDQIKALFQGAKMSAINLDKGRRGTFRSACKTCAYVFKKLNITEVLR